MVSNHCCTRVVKQSAALKQLGWRVDSVARAMPAMPEAFDTVRIVREEEFSEVIAESGAKIIHMHNEPDRLMRYCDEGAKGRPVVYDCHDLGWYRTFSVEPDEAFAFERADGIINVGQEHRDFAFSLHPWTVPEAVVYSTPLKAWVPEYDGVRNGVVYEGGSNPGASNANRFRDHSVVVDKFAEARIPFTLFVPTRALGIPGSRMMVPYRRLLQELPKYEWGFVGTDIKTDKGDVCMPNKMWEYMACGLPIAGCNVPAIERYLDGRAGVFANDMDSLIKKMKKADWGKLHEDTFKLRRFMDDEIRQTIGVYDALLETYDCPICGKVGFKNAIGREGHMRKSHPKEYEAMKKHLAPAE